MWMHVKLRHAAAGALVLCVGIAALPFVARAQADTTFQDSWEEFAAGVGPVLSRHGYYGNGTTLGARLGLTVGVASRLVVRTGGEGAIAFGSESMCVTNTYGGFFAHPTCGTDVGSMWGVTAGLGYVDRDEAGLPRTVVSIAPGVFGITGSYSGTNATGFGFNASVEHRLVKGRSAAAVIGIGVRAVLNVHQDTIVEIPLEFGGWSW